MGPAPCSAASHMMLTEKNLVGRLMWGERDEALLDALTDPLSAGRMHPLAFLGDPAFADAADRTLVRLRRVARAPQMLAIDEQIRAESWRHHDTLWAKLRPAELGRVGVGALETAGSHPSGFVREEAIRRLGARHDGSELPVLLLRVNDWVPQVRRAARARLAERIDVAYADHWVRWLGLWERLSYAGRDDHSAVLGWARTLLRQAEALPALERGMHGDDPYVRRRCHALALENAASDARALFARGLEHRDPIVRAWSIRQALPLVDRALIATALRDRSAMVRREGLEQMLALDPSFDAREALFDRSPAIREIAQRHLRGRGVDVATLYRSARPSPASLLGLGETGTPEDVGMVEDALLSSRVAMREAATRALDRLAGKDHIDDFLAQLEDAPRVRRAAARALERHGVGDRHDRLERIARDRPESRSATLPLLGRIPRWQAIVRLVRIAGVTADALRQIDGWLWRYNRGFSAPSVEELATLERAVGEHATALGDARVRELRAIVATWRR